MAKMLMYYDYYDDQLVPMKMVIYFGRGNLDLSKNTVYVPIEAPFKRIVMEDSNNDTMSMSITQGDLVLNPGRPGQFGISLPLIIQRMEKTKLEQKFDFDYADVEQFIIQMDDLEEVLKMDIRGVYV